jgi:tetratricopeptide (TPR) repeat protein
MKTKHNAAMKRLLFQSGEVLFLCISIFISLAFPAQSVAQNSGEAVSILNTRPGVDMTPMTSYNGGPCTGSILNAHFFPGMIDYSKGNYAYAKQQMDYFIARPAYTAMNPRQGQYLSLALYIRGMIYFRHASGIGRYGLAIADFKSAIIMNPRNYLAHLELAHAYASLSQKEEAIKVLTSLLEMKDLPVTTLNEAKRDLNEIEHGSKDHTNQKQGAEEVY